MISLQRQRTVPPVHGNFHGQRRIDLALELLTNQRRVRRGEINKHPFRGDVWKQSKDQLLVESNDKCAYCEAPTAAVAFGDVEHYRPTTVYWWLAYSLDNYLASCALCNQKYKKDEFPRDGPRWREPRVAKNTTDARLAELAIVMAPDPLLPQDVANYHAEHAAEVPLLVNPYIVDPEPIFAWRPDDVLEEIELVPNAATAGADELVRQAEMVYGLNRLQLKKLRYITYESYRTLKHTATTPGVPADIQAENAAIITRMTMPHRPFAAMIRFFDTHGIPAP